MNFLMLRYFKAVADELNITHAAQKLYISQQALSFHIKNLETELGVKLFNRTPGLSLTDAGRYLYEAAEKYENVTDSLNDRLNEIRSEIRGELRLGLSFTRGQFILPSILPAFSDDHPNVHVRIFEEHSEELLDKLLKNDIDFWITAENPNVEGIIKETLFTEEYFLVVPERVLEKTYGYEKTQAIKKKIQDNLELTDIIACPFVLLNPGNRSRDKLDNAMRFEKLTPNIMLETENSQTAFALAQNEMALTVYSDMFLRNYSGRLNPRVMLIPFDKYLQQDILNVCYKEEINSSKYKRNFLERIHKAF